MEFLCLKDGPKLSSRKPLTAQASRSRAQPIINLVCVKVVASGLKRKTEIKNGVPSTPFSLVSQHPSNNIEVIQPRHHVAALGFLAVQLDLQAQVVETVDVPERILVGNHAGFVENEQRQDEGQQAELARFRHDFLDLVHVALEDQVGDERRVEQDLDRGDAAVGSFARDQALRDEGLEV